MTEDPAQYPRILQDSGALEAVSLSREDQTRTAANQHNAQRQQLVHSTGDYDDYLHSLQQLAVVDGISETYLDRVTQLVNKSNQFNLTTLRKSRSQIEALLSDDAVASFTIRLSDRFGDNGLICVCWGHQEQDVFHIDQWLMSCRVLKRGVEKLLCNQIVKRCRSEGFQLVQGTYIPTPKNKMVEDLYSTLGFSLRQQQEDGKTTWTLDTKKFEPFDVAIQIVDHY